jgi:hypothetical protein
VSYLKLSPLYGKHMMFRNILSGKVTTPASADAFLKAVSEAGQQAKIAEAKETRSNYRRCSMISCAGPQSGTGSGRRNKTVRRPVLGA